MTAAPATAGGSGYARDAALAAIARMAPLIVQLLATPLVIATTGTGVYAVWALLMTTINLMLTADLGVVGIMQRYHGIARGRGDAAMGGRITATVLLVLAVLLVALTLLGPLIADAVMGVIRVSPEVEPAARDLFRNAGTLAILQLVGLAFASYLAASSRFGAAAISSIAARVGSFITILVLLGAGAGLHGLLVAAYVDAAAVVVLGAAFSARHLLFEVRAIVRRSEMAELWSYAWRNQASALGFVAQRESDVVMAAIMLSSAYQAAVASTAQLAAALALAPTVLLAPLFTRLSVAAGRAPAQAVAEARSAETTWFSLVLPFAAAVVSIGPFFASVWLGPDVPNVVVVMSLLSFGFLVVLANSVRAILVRALGKPGVETWSYVVLFAVKLAVGIPATLQFGVLGLVASGIVASATAVIALWLLTKRALPDFHTGRVTARSVVASVVIAITGAAGGFAIVMFGLERTWQLALFAVLGVLVVGAGALILRWGSARPV